MSEYPPAEMLDAIPQAAVLIGADQRIVAANQAAHELLADPSPGRHHITVLRQPTLLDAIEACLRDRKRYRTRYLTSDGAQDMTFDVTCAAAGHGVVVIFDDISHMERAGQMRRDFVANVSHELRTPLTALSGFIETLRGPARDDPAARERFLGIMEAEAGRMNRLIGDLLSLSRVESAERVRPTERVGLSGCLDSVVRNLSPLAHENGVTLTLDPIAPGTQVIGDQDQLMQVFTNLVENAIKYSGDGTEVTVSASTPEHEPGLRAPGVRVTVADTGPGIDPIHIPRLTERFYRVDGHRSRAMGGTGLGLAIVKHIVNRHRGRMRIISEPGEGAQFVVTLPVHAR